ncbi:MAG: response regulator [bacterium]
MARVLIVDDEVSILTVIGSILQSEGHKTVTASDGLKAKKLILNGGFDLMISDIRMTPINGMELLKLAHDHHPTMAVIMLTAYGQVETAVEALQLGAFDYVAKPFKTSALIATVKRALDFRKLESSESAGAGKPVGAK